MSCRALTVVAALLLMSETLLAQPRAVPRREIRAIPLDGVPAWLKDHAFRQSKFTFVRIQYETVSKRRRLSWATDYPDADVALAVQIGALTRLDVSEPTRVLKLADQALSQYPFTYLAEPGMLALDEAEIKALREYLLGGGFLMIDDFWGDAEWEHLRGVMQTVFPDREVKDLPLSHPLFHCVFDLKEKPQATSIHHFLTGLKTERNDAQQAHYRAIFDEQGRMMAVMCHNTDLADGWERAADDATYRREVSQKKAFPMGVNIVFYALTQKGGR